jgi:HTH-type transcriptional regulator, glycine betaine synthesis regulator
MPSKLDPRQRQFIEEFGNLYAAYGFKRLSGMLIGLLLASDGPLCLDDICHHLNRSKGAISESTRRLNSLGIIKKIEGPESRKDYYIADSDIFINVFHFNMATVRKNLSIADQFQHLLEGGNPKHLGRWRENLKVMNSFYQLMSEFYDGFDGKWTDHKKTVMNS